MADARTLPTMDLGLICPASQGGEAAWAGRIEVLAAPSLLSLINHFRGTQVLTPPETAGIAEAGRVPDLAEVGRMRDERWVVMHPKLADVYMTALAYVGALVVFQVGRLFL